MSRICPQCGGENRSTAQFCSFCQTQLSTLGPGTILQNRYEILGLLGSGGMGAVYQAIDQRLNVRVAIKEMTAQPGLDPRTLNELLSQFQQEAQVLARLNHRNLVRVSDFIVERNSAYLVMDLVQGDSLATLIARHRRLSEVQVLNWADQLLDALEYCHSQNVIHRDIKPENVIIRPDGQAVLIDFGLVKLWDANNPQTRTVLEGMGTPEYTPPEQYSGHLGHTDPRSDLYGLGATMYHALGGQAPITATHRMAMPGEFKPVRLINPQISAQMEYVVLRAMELSIDARFASASEMRRALHGEVPLPTPPVSSFSPTTPLPPNGTPFMPPPVPLVRPAKKSGCVWAAVAVLALVGLLACGLIAASFAGNLFKNPTPSPTFSIQTPARVPTSSVAPGSPTNTSGPSAGQTKTPNTTPTLAPTSTYIQGTVLFYAQVVDGPLNVRSGPGTDQTRIAQLEDGACVPVYAINAANDWLNVRLSNGQMGWIARQYVRIDPSPRCDTVQPTATPTRPTYTVNAHFRADSTSLKSGECTYLRWEVDGVQAVYLEGAGRAGHDSQRICPAKTQTFTLKVVLKNGQAELHTLTIQVGGGFAATPAKNGPLSIEYTQTNIYCPSRGSYVVEFYISAQGGDGRYTYYRDIDQIGGPMSGGLSYQLTWQSCGGAPGTFKVKSGDGQEASKNFWVNPPSCCTR